MLTNWMFCICLHPQSPGLPGDLAMYSTCKEVEKIEPRFVRRNSRIRWLAKETWASAVDLRLCCAVGTDPAQVINARMLASPCCYKSKYHDAYRRNLISHLTAVMDELARLQYVTAEWKSRYRQLPNGAPPGHYLDIFHCSVLVPPPIELKKSTSATFS